MSTFNMLLNAIAIVLITLLTANNAFSAGSGLSPSETTTLINHAMQYQPGAKRREITTPFVERIRTDDLSEMELFFKGEWHFLHFEPEASRDAYWEFRNRSDLFGRVAFQRLMIIRINAFGMVAELLEKDIPEYNRRFPVQPYDRYGITYAVSRTASAMIEQDHANEALDLIVQHVTLHDEFDSAYIAYRLPGQFLEVARQNGRATEFIELHDSLLAGLDAVIKKRLVGNPTKVELVKRLPGIVFRSLFDDSDLGFHQWTAEMMELRDQLRAAKSMSINDGFDPVSGQNKQ